MLSIYNHYKGRRRVEEGKEERGKRSSERCMCTMDESKNHRNADRKEKKKKKKSHKIKNGGEGVFKNKKKKKKRSKNVVILG
ncbi:hypothetical protein POVCU1_001190 [Plasmodium ovale curtisi]|uniref:Uncharacterized protein n=1 Tax=Plasmodium ovale curtisi TaxID=864141 RepID=A0A1A8VJ25_PLAOA|nr:hypothetical protein POVCU1_001190 [Plasmodium ovale curtisi]